MVIGRRWWVSSLAVMLLFSVLTVVAQQPALALTELPPGGTFTDDDETLEEGHIEAIFEAGITKGCNPPANDRFCADRAVTRGEMATFLVRALKLPRATEPDHFTDDDGSVHRNSIDSLFEAGVTKGCGAAEDATFCPDREVTRGEMAAFLARGFVYPVAETDFFGDDDDSIFNNDINRIATAGITRGCGADAYCPRAPMIRAHMAVFLSRALQLTPNTPPPKPRVTGQFTTYYTAGQSRVINIHKIADATDGAIVQPGATFSLNARVGRRTTSKGYVRAGAIIGGKIVCCDSYVNIGGGTSQFATTLYNAIFFAGVADVYHKPHSIYFSRYPMGREATLGWTGPDVKFRNNTDYPITIDTSHTRSSVTVKLIGSNGGRRVSAYRSGSATTRGGGSVTVTRVIRYRDGTRSTERWYHRYNPLQ
jgi:hypothetical protein